MNFEKSVIALHKKSRGKLELIPTVPIKDKKDLSLVYTPGVGIISKIISENPERVWDLTIKSHMVAVISDGSAVLGLGN
ncbi:MAG: NAD-dependent malic enzyme, partial [Candidatus Daviesbacteria bacterium GW2011_GWB1_41_5]